RVGGLVASARCGVELEEAIAVDVADLDLVDEGVGLLVHLDHMRSAAVFSRPKHRHDAGVVRGKHEVLLAVAGDIADLEVTQALETTAPGALPQHLGVPSSFTPRPVL